MLRVILIPVFVSVLMTQNIWESAHYAALGVFIAASLTDLFDGKIARKRNLVTNFGKFADPLADKLLVCSALIVFIHFNSPECELIPTWVVLVIVAREFIISGFRLVAAEQGIVLAASKLAKWKTTTQMVMTILILLDFGILRVYAPWLVIAEYVLIYASLVLTVLSLVEYIYKNRSLMKGQM